MAGTPLLFDLGLVIIAATIISLVMRMLRQPLVLGYVIGGFIIGPSLLQFVTNPSEIEVLSELGIAFLLFVIGLELDLKKIRQVGPISAAIGTAQVALTFAAGFGVSLLLGFSTLIALYIGLGVSFSSTMVVIKLLSDNKELESLHGELVLGIMLVQDIVAIFALSLLPSLDKMSVALIGTFVFKVLLFAAIFAVVNKFLLAWLMRQVSSNTELLFLAALSVIFAFAFLATSLGFSIEIGAFLAGLALSATPLHLDIRSKIEPLRDFFLTIFFVTLGMQISFANIDILLVPMLVIVAVGILVKGLITFFVLKWFRYGNRTSFLTGVQIAQVGEFSLVLAALGLSLKQISVQIGSLMTLIMLASILIATYLIKWDDRMFERLQEIIPALRQSGAREESLASVDSTLHDHIVIFGYHKMTPQLMRLLLERKKKFVIVDHNPEKVRKLLEKGVDSVCASLSNPDVYEKVNFADARIVISTVNVEDKNMFMLQRLKAQNPKALAIVVASGAESALALYGAGADYVLIPESLAAEKIRNYLIHLSPDGIRSWGKKHLAAITQEIADEDGMK